MSWGISETATTKEKIFNEVADELRAMNSVVDDEYINYGVYSKLFDMCRELADREYEQGRKDANEWIPVSERLPEINGSYLCFMRCELDEYYDGFRYHPKRIVEGYEVLEFRDDGFYTGKIYSFKDFRVRNDVIAWKPIEPYTVDKEWR